MKAATADLFVSAPDIQKNWGWYLTLGIAMIALGIYAIYAERSATTVSIVVLGVILALGGISEIALALSMRNAGHMFLMLLVGVLYIVAGVMLCQHPEAGAQTVTLLLAVLFVFDGIYRVIAALWLQFPQWGWYALSGLVTVALGVMLWAQYPNSAAWFIGFAVGVNLILAGIAWCAFALRVKSGPVQVHMTA